MGRLMGIFRAIDVGNLEAVKKNIEKGVDINIVNKEGLTPLHLAAIEGNLDLIKYLLDHGADINFHTEDNDTPVEMASINNRIEAVKLLISKGCDINQYCSACHYAASMNYYEILKILLNNGADVNKRDYSGRTPAHWAAQEGYLNILKLLSDYGADFNTVDQDEATPLYIAASENHLDIVKYLIGKNVIIDYETDTTAFMIACAFDCYEVATELLNAGADINHKDSDGRTALFYAKVQKKRKLQEFLLSKGASSDIVDNTGISIADLSNGVIRKKLYDELF